MKLFVLLSALFLPVFLSAAVPSASIDMGATDIENGLANTQTAHPSDGENEAVQCGPEGDIRDCRKNWANDDPTPDTDTGTWPDTMFYFNVTNDEVKSEERLKIEATVYDDPGLQPNTTLNLQYTNNKSTGPTDIGNTFAGHPVAHVLEGTGEWVTVSWEISDAGFRTFMQNTSDFRILISNSQRLCMDTVVVTVNNPVYPTDLKCVVSERTTVTLTWVSFGTYESLVVKRDGEQIADLNVEDTSYVDTDVPEGSHTYEVLATAEGTTEGPSCEVTILPDMTGQSVSVDLGEEDVENGLENSHTAPPDGGDGENEAVECGPEGDLRQARKNWGADDPTPDGLNGETLYPDTQFYFNVLTPEIKGQDEFVLSAVVYDDPDLPEGTALLLQYTLKDATGPGDIPNVFFPLDGHLAVPLGPTGEWVTVEWLVENAGFRSFQQGDSDFRIGVNNGSRVCMDSVTLTVGIPDFPFDLACAVEEQNVTLSWRAYRSYESISVLRDGEVIATLTDNETSYVDEGVEPGDHTYTVQAEYEGESGGESCDVTVESLAPEFVRGDINDDGSVDIADPISLLGHLFGGAGDLPAPFPNCGSDTTDDQLGSCTYEHCP